MPLRFEFEGRFPAAIADPRSDGRAKRRSERWKRAGHTGPGKLLPGISV